MQLDFHFYAIYTICKLAGLKHDYCKTIAYASQHTDDAKYDHVLEFMSGGRYQQQMSAYKFFEYNVIDKKTRYDVFLPFHFLPGVAGTEFYEKLLCRKNSVTANELLQDTLRTLDKPYGLHRLGVTFHVYADTWSHQGFDGLGHNYAEANHNDINDPKRCMDALFHIFLFLNNQVRSHIELYENKPAKWNEIKDKFVELLSIRDTIENRELLWQQKISEGYFGFKSNVAYDDREWFNEAVEVIDKDKKIYDRKRNFQTSDWKYFHDALTLHKFYVKNELLPKYGIIT